MSTRLTLAHGEGFHCFQEMFGSAGVYIELSEPVLEYFEASPKSVTIKIPSDIWEIIRQKKLEEGY